MHPFLAELLRQWFSRRTRPAPSPTPVHVLAMIPSQRSLKTPAATPPESSQDPEFVELPPVPPGCAFQGFMVKDGDLIAKIRVTDTVRYLEHCARLRTSK